jgi:uncharacterized Zn-finger protein
MHDLQYGCNYEMYRRRLMLESAAILPMIFAHCPNPLKSVLYQLPLPEIAKMSNATTQAVELEGKDLPAHCPNPAMPLWSSHPRVFLDFNHDGEAKCPYCGTAYRLKPGTVVPHH